MLADDIAVTLALHGPLTVADIAVEVGAPERDVSLCLFGSHGRFRLGSCPQGRAASEARWSLQRPASGSPPEGPQATAEEGGQGVGWRGGQRGAASWPRVDRREAPVTAPALGLPRLAGETRAAFSGARLYPWQEEALAAWRRQGRRGVVEAVTGAGKTMVGVAAALEQLHLGGQVVVLVPTLELADQWGSLLQRFLPSRWRPGRMGAGSRADLAGYDVLVAVVNSARIRDVRPTRRGGLLVADECHRYGSSVNHLALDRRFPARLGFSATYAREDDGNLAWLDPYFGGTCFQLGYEKAVRAGVVAPFSVTLAGCLLAPDEQQLYDELSELLRALFARLVGDHGLPAEPFEEFLRAVLVIAGRAGGEPGSEVGEVARSYRQACSSAGACWPRRGPRTPCSPGSCRRCVAPGGRSCLPRA